MRVLVGAGALILPACSTLDTPAPTEAPPTPPRLVTRPAAPNPTIIPAGAQIKSDQNETSVPPARGAAALPPVPAATGQGKPLPIDLTTALTLTNASPLDIQIAGERLRAAGAALDRAKVMWLPNVSLGLDYFRQDGQIQDVVGNVFTTSKSSFLVGGGPTAVFPLSEAYYAPLAARQVLRARRADVETARNDTTLSVAEAYFTVQQARGEVAGSVDALRRAEELVKLTEKVAPDLAPTVEVSRAKTEVSRRRQSVEAAYERWQVASADLTRVLRLEAGTLVEPAEEPSLVVELIDPAAVPDDLIPIALTNRPELASDQALIQAALVRVRQEKVRPFVPTVALRGTGSQVPGLAGGYFGGGTNDTLSNFAGRYSFDLQAVWEVQNLGMGNRAAIREREAEQRASLLQLLRTQERVSAEVVQAHAQLRRSANRLKAAEEGVIDAAETAEKNLRGLVPGKRVGDQLALVFRPQEAVAAVAALDQAYRDYYGAVADHNRAQFRLHRALGNPAQRSPNAPARPAPVVPPPTMPPPIVRPASDAPAPPGPVPAVSAENPVRRASRAVQPTDPLPVSVYPAGQSPRRP
ncbi:TolC family protein [Gemmata sp. G18]|uniref:TolC family protein n=1 Tax=Gemmata palustris TaxID=2822762 RepID=A0ABS5BLK8_9BACT|nr:TolC family protein [Gemmata palustris]MBP3954581.1 TolC family protein [Gemmata palustris]